MKRFKFTFETILNLKRQIEKDIKNKLSVEIKKLNDANALLSELYEKRDYVIESFSNNRNNQNRITDLISFYDYIEILDKKIEITSNDIEAIQDNIKIIRTELAEALREKQTLEKLEEKEFEEFKYELNQVEQKSNDEINSYKFYKKIKSNNEG